MESDGRSDSYIFGESNIIVQTAGNMYFNVKLDKKLPVNGAEV
jgi:hypothetical protein